MPSPAKRYTQRSSPRRGGGGGDGGGGESSPTLESAPVGSSVKKLNLKNNDNADNGEAEQSSRPNNANANNNNNNNNDPTMFGKRTGVTLPPRGEIPLNDDGMEDADAFFAAAKSPAPSSLTKNNNKSAAPGGGSSSGGSLSGKSFSPGYRTTKFRERERRDEERRKRHEELEEGAKLNALKRPDILNANDEDDDDDEGEGGDDGRDGKSGASRKNSYQPTPKQPNWSNRLLHQAMGVPTEESPQYTVLSKVSTATRGRDGGVPGTQGSLDTIATESRHALRNKQSQVQLDQLAGIVGDETSPPGVGAAQEEDEDEDEEVEFDGPMDPPEELSQESSQQSGSGGGGGGEKRGMDPEERDEYLEPEASAKSAASGSTTDALETSLEEVVYNNSQEDFGDDNEGEGGMQFATQPEDNNDEDNDFGGGGNDGGFDDNVDNEDEDDGFAASSQQSRKSNASSEEEDEEVPKKKKGKKEKKSASASSSVSTTPTSVLRTKKSKKKKQTTNRVNWSTPNGISTGIPTGNRQFETHPVSDYKEDYPPGEEPKTPRGSTILRRSRRAKFAPLKFWKNEKLILEPQNESGLLGEAMGDMPVVAGVLHALPTPYKEVKRKERPEEDNGKKKKSAAASKKRGRKNGDDEDSDGEESSRTKTPFDDKAVRKKYRINNGESGSVWSETLESATSIKIVSRLDNRSFSKLPLSSTRKSRESKVVGFASQAFHVPTDDDDLFPGYIAGNVVLPPRGIKDAEGVGLCSQVFNVGDCQPNSVEFALADPSGQDGEFDPKTAQRYLLSKGDMFQIPPGNVYRIENHSKVEKANLFWTIIKCTSRAEQEDSDEE